ncbi:MAG TPA: MDR family MFS transporter [Oscillatoriaceae cyanobacterium]
MSTELPQRRRETHRAWVTGALLLAMFMAAIEGTIVATAMPRIVSDLGGFSLYSWVFSMYLLTQVATIPIYGKLADQFGRKPVFLVGVSIFLVGSFLCGHAHTMLELIAFRTLQGIGSGAVQPIATTVVGDLYTAEERHRVQGWISSVWAVSAIFGPALGGFIVEYAHWAWIFYLNIPLGLVALAGLFLFLHEHVEHHAHAIDFPGALLLVVAIASFMVAVLQGGTAWSWASPQSLGLLAVTIVGILLLVLWESRYKEPILPMWLFRTPLIRVAGGTSFFNGALMLGYTAMIPTFVQGVLGGSALQAGFALAVMSIGWPLASFSSGPVMRALGYKRMALLGGVLTVLAALEVWLTAHAGVGYIAAGVFVVGMGLGFLSNALIITVQSVVPWQQRGVATANLMFMRTLGSTVGVAVAGAFLNLLLLRDLHGVTLPLAKGQHAIDLVNQLLNPEQRRGLAAIEAPLVTALGSALHGVFLVVLAFAVIGLVWSLRLPKNQTPAES